MILLRCLAHLINLATQAVIKAHPKSKFYDPLKPDDHMLDASGFLRDTVGLVCAICVKVIDYLYPKTYTHFLFEGTLISKTYRAL
jgi:hypothetical protein